MSRFVTEVLPKALTEAQDNRKLREAEKWQVSMRLDEDDRLAGHRCDCEYCESQDYTPLTKLEREDLEGQFEKLDLTIKNLDRDIASMTSYQEMMQKAE